MKSKLKDICDISTGVYVKTERIGDTYYLQARDFDAYNQLESNLKQEVLSHNINDKHFLRSGDVIVAAKGVNHFAFTFNEEVSPAVASSMFIVLRQFDEDKVDSGFVTWYINHPKTQAYLDRSSKGSGIPSINKGIVGDLEINIPSIDKQKLILSTDKLKIKASQLQDKISVLKNEVINEQLIKLVK
ncbi:restriction endonuclease subunit S [Winogradskyella undariae]|uniref:restriction endonuclease subunit S n=1 Tax=Winogradskyella undariae TaxID=1285465 RepID=UPI0015C9ABE6|nr:restriction endonuclease subunit S [Winogradskyella undariae]